MRVLVAAVTEQNRLLTANNATNALIDVLREAEVDRKNAEASCLEAQTIREEAQIERERLLVEAAIDREDERIRRERVNNQAVADTQQNHNNRQMELIDLIQRLQTVNAQISLDSYNIAQVPKSRKFNSVQVVFYGKANENLDEWLYNTKLNIDMALYHKLNKLNWLLRT